MIVGTTILVVGICFFALSAGAAYYITAPKPREEEDWLSKVLLGITILLWVAAVVYAMTTYP